MTRRVRFSFALLAVSMLSIPSVSAQTSDSKEVVHQKMIWTDYFQNINIHDKWFLPGEIGERFYIDPAEQFLFGVRLYALYNVGESWSIGPGFSVWFPKTGDIHTHELRPAQQFLFRQKMEKRKRLGISHRIKVEERFVRKVEGGEIADGYNFSMRFRYRFAIEYTFAKLGEKERPMKAFLNDEVFVQAGKHVIYNVFDQNRFFCGVSAMFAKGTTISASYGNVARQLSAGNIYHSNHTLRISLTHDLKIERKN